MYDKRLNIFTGHFGSGKTEVAINYVCKLAELYKTTAIVDFDIVNPYFRTADAKTELEAKGVKVILPLYANTNVDVPALPGEINTLFERKEYRTVFDVGGDDLGARALSRYREDIIDDDYEMFFVINTNRPMTDTIEKIEEMINDIEESSRIKITKLVNNTNMLENTTTKDFLKGHELIQTVSDKLNIPIEFLSGYDNVISPLKNDIKIEQLILKKMIKLPWDR